MSSVFERSLDAAIREIEEHPRGRLFRRLIEYGTPDPDDPKVLTSDGESTLSDPECGLCVDFIHSHMVNRFKGELAELLALEPCVRLMEQLRDEGRWPADVRLYWGERIQERRHGRRGHDSGRIWGGFASGADGLFVSVERDKSHRSKLLVHGIAEVKSMARSKRLIFHQIERHRSRLVGGVRLGSREWSPGLVRSTTRTARIVVVPSQWKVSRAWHRVRIDSKTAAIVSEEMSGPPVETRVERLGDSDWQITLAWSQEALTDAAYEMTVWYMAQVGARVFATQTLPRGLEFMTPEEAGVNQMKYRLYVIGLRYISRRQERKAMRIYNAYAFGSPLAVDSGSEMLWPQDLEKGSASGTAAQADEDQPTLNMPTWRVRKLFSSRSDLP